MVGGWVGGWVGNRRTSIELRKGFRHAVTASAQTSYALPYAPLMRYFYAPLPDLAVFGLRPDWVGLGVGGVGRNIQKRSLL